MKNIFAISITIFCIANLLSQTTPTPQLVQFATGFSRPVDIAHCGDDRLFIVEQHQARIKILLPNGTTLPTPFLNLGTGAVSNGNEQGLLGLAFHPNYAQNGYFYINLTKPNGDTKVSRYTVSATDPNVADPNSELILFEVDQPYSNHNGGCMKFGPDGYLYIGLGDGGSGGDPQANGQKRTTLLGKLLRIDVDGSSPYAIPASNPFVNDASTLDEIWALGLRNPWRFSFDRQTGDLWIGDVGQDSWEEIDFQPASSAGGENYGWRCYEGTHVFNTGNCPPVGDLTPPVAEYENSSSMGCSVTGGFVYRGFRFPNMYGRYFHTDYCTGRFWSTKPNGSGGWVTEQLADFVNNQLVSFGENRNGQLFAAALGSGIIYRLEDPTELWEYAVNAFPSPCSGTTDGIIQVTLGTNVPAATFLWDDGSTEQIRSGLAEGTYTVTITGANGATAVETVSLAPSVNLSASVVGTSCTGVSDGSIDLTLNGTAQPPTSVSWSDGATTLDRTNLAPGTYAVTVTSFEGCVIEQTFLVENTNSISLGAVVTDVSCVWEPTDGSIDLTLVGTNQPPASVLWDNGSTTLDLTGLSGGEYSVIVVTAEGCVFNESYLVEQPIPNDFPFIGLANDSLLFIDAIWAPLQWLLNGEPIPGANSPTFMATVSGTYSVQVGTPDCNTMSNSIYVNLSATRTIEGLKSVTLTPNPAQHSVQLTVTATEPLLLELFLNDLQGRNFRRDKLAVNGTATRTFDLGEVPSGNYLLLLKNNKGEWVERLVKL